MNDGDGMVGAMCMDLGTGQVPYHMAADALAVGSLVELIPDFQPLPTPISAIYSSGRLVPARVRAVLDLFETPLG